MAVTFTRAYQGFQAGQVADLPSELETALVAQGFATSGGTLTSGAISTTLAPAGSNLYASGFAAVAAGASSVAVTIPGVTTQHKAWAVVAQATADGTLTQVLRVNCTANTVTITGNANATALTRVAFFVAV
jgi:hypothetical protein